MKNRLSTLLLITATLLVAGCNKDVNTITIKAHIHDYNSDSKVYVDASNYSSWILGDQVAINSTIATVSGLSNRNHTGTISLPEDQELAEINYAVYPADAVTSTAGVTASGTTVHLPSMQKCVLDANGHQVINALMASQGGTTMDFYNLCALLKVQVPVDLHVTDIYVTTFVTNGENTTSGGLLWGNGTITFPENGARPQLSSLTKSQPVAGGIKDGGDTVYLHVVENTSDGVYYIAVPAVSDINFKIWVNYKNTATDQYGNNQNFYYCSIKKQSGNCNTLNANQIGVVDFSDIDIPDPTNPDPRDFNPGIYSVSDDMKVNFAKGNLIYHVGSSGSDGTGYYWTYHTQQYTCDGYNITMSHGNPASGSHSEYAKMCLQMNNGTVVAYPDNNGQYNNASFYDWGNFINNQTPEDQTDDRWFTLSLQQWSYLLYTRNVSYARFAKVQVNGANGLLLFPDEFLWPDDAIAQPANLNNATSSYTAAGHNYTVAEFETLEEAGCVFLKANGYFAHNNSTADDVLDADAGCYWTSDFDNSEQTTSYLYFNNTYIAPNSTAPQHHQGYAHNIRLARQAD